MGRGSMTIRPQDILDKTPEELSKEFQGHKKKHKHPHPPKRKLLNFCVLKCKYALKRSDRYYCSALDCPPDMRKKYYRFQLSKRVISRMKLRSRYIETDVVRRLERERERLKGLHKQSIYNTNSMAKRIVRLTIDEHIRRVNQAQKRLQQAIDAFERLKTKLKDQRAHVQLTEAFSIWINVEKDRHFSKDTHIINAKIIHAKRDAKAQVKAAEKLSMITNKMLKPAVTGKKPKHSIIKETVTYDD